MTSDGAAQTLTLMYNQLLSVAEVPADWKKAMIVPVYNEGTAGAVANHRPISLTSVLNKILERILAVKIIDHLRTNNLLESNVASSKGVPLVQTSWSHLMSGLSISN